MEIFSLLNFINFRMENGLINNSDNSDLGKIREEI